MKFSLKTVCFLLVVSLFLASCASTKDVAKEAKETVLPETVSTPLVVEQPQSVVSKPEEEKETQPVQDSETEATKPHEDVVEKADVTVEEIYFGPKPANKQEEKPAENTAVNQENNQVPVEQKEAVNTQQEPVQSQPAQTMLDSVESAAQDVSAQAYNPSLVMLFVVVCVLAFGCVAGFISKAVKKRKNS